MHAPDGFLDGPTSAAMGLVAVGGVGVALKRAGQVLDERQVPLAGLASAFIFAVQMLNFPVAGGTSGHLLGGVLAAVLLGPWIGAICVTVVVVVQAVLFADGGLTALGANVINMALVTALGGYLVFVALSRVMARNPAGIALAAGLAAGVGVVLSSMAFTLQYAIGGAGGASAGTVGWAMIGTHVLIGIGEGIITGLAVGAVLASRPDLVHGARHLAGRTTPDALQGVAS
ncbi:energy-coupling factor ABC transporter permease [Iamia sp.]|uniref:energy-coupling factor ABC transporter permease n=1 Tax=Iamia sp. TaxID=2722710 RepID=UPI002D0A969E|nr:energy-coupling factor ABC transporter permease [Iamia sp.]HXH56023.1 energy-coupling factor ABC transporter permease [Iamia sp.]